MQLQQLTLFDTAVYKINKAAKHVNKVIQAACEQIECIQTKIKILANHFYMCIPDLEGELDTIIDVSKTNTSMFSRKSIQYFMQNIFNTNRRELLF